MLESAEPTTETHTSTLRHAVVGVSVLMNPGAAQPRAALLPAGATRAGHNLDPQKYGALLTSFKNAGAGGSVMFSGTASANSDAKPTQPKGNS